MQIIHFPDSDDTVHLVRAPDGLYIARLIVEDGETSLEYGTGNTELSAIADLNKALAGD